MPAVVGWPTPRRGGLAGPMNQVPEGKLHPIESKYVVVAAVAAFLLALLLTGGSLMAGFGAMALIAGIGWAVRRIRR